MYLQTSRIQWLYWLAWAALLLLTCIPLTFGSEAGHDRDDRHQRGRGRAGQTDVNFMKGLMDFEFTAIALARAGSDKSTHSDMRNYLEGVERNCSRRIERLRDWLYDWYGVRYEPRLDEKYDGRLSVLRNPSVRGDEFEIRLLKTTIEQHQEEAAMVAQNLPYLQHDELRQTAQTVHERRRIDARQLQSWLKQWYDITWSSDIAPPRKPLPYKKR